MAFCPNCGSDHIAVLEHASVNWGRGIAGYLLFGGVGGAVGAMTGTEQVCNSCMDCGQTWNAKELFEVLKSIEIAFNIRLDLSFRDDRIFLKRYVAEAIPLLEQRHKLREEAELSASSSQTYYHDNKFGRIGYFLIILGIAFLFVHIGLSLFIWVVSAFFFSFSRNEEKKPLNQLKIRKQLEEEKVENQKKILAIEARIECWARENI